MTADQARLYEIDIQFELDVPNFPEGRVKEAISFVLSRHEVEEGTALSLVVTDSERVRALNSQYRGVDAPTDVLSFSADPLPDNLIEEMEDESSYLGDLIVAYPYTAHQAERDGHALDDELILLAVHGTLHLLGYEHDNDEHQTEMWHSQSEALRAAEIAIDVPLFIFGDDRVI